MAVLQKLFQSAKNREKNIVYCPVEGELKPLEEVGDPVFAERTLGGGIAVIPKKGEVYAPADGVLEAVFPTGHALAMRTDDGTEILIHIGIDTVKMNGDGFKSLVEQGQQVVKGQLLVEFDPDKIKGAGLETTTMVIVTNGSDLGEMHLTEDKAAAVGERLIWF